MYFKFRCYTELWLVKFYSDRKENIFLGTYHFFARIISADGFFFRGSNTIKPIAHQYGYEEFSCYRPVVSVTMQTLIKVSQPIARRRARREQSTIAHAITDRVEAKLRHAS